MDCGESDLRVLDFDHVRDKKTLNVPRMAAARTYGWERIQQEIAKCEVRCANCHRKRTYAQFDYRNWLSAPDA